MLRSTVGGTRAAGVVRVVDTRFEYQGNRDGKSFICPAASQEGGNTVDNEWLQVRIRRATAERLREFGRRILRLANEGRVEAEVHGQGFVGFDVCVNVLLDRDAKHQARNARAKKK
jgi:hypothetical protein